MLEQYHCVRKKEIGSKILPLSSVIKCLVYNKKQLELLLMIIFRLNFIHSTLNLLSIVLVNMENRLNNTLFSGTHTTQEQDT